MSKITKVIARQVFDSRGNPTIEAEVYCKNSSASSICPSGASTGTYEAYEKRDKTNKRYLGKSVLKPVSYVNKVVSKRLKNQNVHNQEKIDHILIKLDGTKQKTKIGANAILAISMAVKKLSAKIRKIPLYKSFIVKKNFKLPYPLMNIINGGAHANNGLRIQEFMIRPDKAKSFVEGVRICFLVINSLRTLIKKMGHSTSVGDEGGFAPNLNSSSEVIETILEAVKKSGYNPEEEVAIALDAAASEFHKDGKYLIEDEELSSNEMVDYLVNLANQYPIISIEDGLSEDDWEGWTLLTEKLGDNIQLVGDDLFVTQEKILQKGIDENAANSILIKINQVGTITETLETMTLGKKNNYTSMVSHRSGETEDTFISHLVTGTSSGQIKTGAPARSERAAKYNELLRIGEKVGFETFNNKKWKN